MKMTAIALCGLALSVLTPNGARADDAIGSYGFAVNDNMVGLVVGPTGTSANGIAIDEGGVHVAGIAIDEPGVHINGISIDEPGVHVAGLAIDEGGTPKGKKPVKAGSFVVTLDGKPLKGIYLTMLAAKTWQPGRPVYGNFTADAKVWQPGKPVYGNLTFTIDLSAPDVQLVRWMNNVSAGKTDRRSISVIFHNDAGEESGRVNLSNVTPARGYPLNDSKGSRPPSVAQLELFFDTYESK